MVSVKDYGAVGDGQTDDTTSLRSALNDAATNGYTLFFPEGIYNYSEPLVINVPSVAVLQTGRAINLRGTGSANCGLNWLGDKDTNGLKIIGIGQRTNFPRLRISGLRFVRPDPGPTLEGHQGAALTLENLTDVGIDDCTFFRHGYGLRLIGCLVVALYRCAIIYNDIGLRCEQGSFTSTPNVITAHNCVFDANFSRGVQFTGGSANAFVDCLFESIGEGQNTASIAAEMAFLGAAGAVGATFERCYFEGNQGKGIYWYGANDLPQTLSVISCNFNRFTGNDREAIVVDFASRQAGSSPALLRLEGSTFYGYNGYTPDPAKPYLGINTSGGYDGLTIAGLNAILRQSASDFGTIPANVKTV